MSVTDDLANELARDVLTAMDEMEDDRFYIEVGKLLASMSPSMEDAFMTAMRVRLAERRARVLLGRKLTGFRAAKQVIEDSGEDA